ncbi:SDR family oxidoreductase [Legionella bozemanae]|uniref:SDR family oxidoreductase n=1 Tax=Legionella bozemanae TaxID=447 RepID=UPI00399CC8FC
MSNTKKRLIIIGGTSGIGLATAKLALQHNLQLVITGFKPIQPVIKAELPEDTEFYQLDISDEIAVKDFFTQIGKFDYLTTPGSVIPTGDFLTMDTAVARSGFDSKFWGQYYAAKYGAPFVRKGGALVLFSGVISQRPKKNLVVMAAVNSAIEGLGKALAIELAPLRINVIAPGVVDTPRYAAMNPTDKKEMFHRLENMLPVGHVGKPSELAETVLFLLRNEFMTGQTVFVEGGHLLV